MLEVFGSYFDEYRESILSQIRELGYRVQIKLLNASDYGVPQLRPRVVIIGIRCDEKKLFHYPIERPENTKTVGETLVDLMKTNGWKDADAWAASADTIAPTIVGGSKKTWRTRSWSGESTESVGGLGS